jgi:hypothetical protein
MSLKFNIDQFNSDFSPPFFMEISKNDLKNITKDFCRSYKNGMIPEETFHQVIEHLLAYFIEQSLDEKIYSRDQYFDEKLFKIRSSSKR